MGLATGYESGEIKTNEIWSVIIGKNQSFQQVSFVYCEV